MGERREREKREERREEGREEKREEGREIKENREQKTEKSEEQKEKRADANGDFFYRSVMVFISPSPSFSFYSMALMIPFLRFPSLSIPIYMIIFLHCYDLLSKRVLASWNVNEQHPTEKAFFP